MAGERGDKRGEERTLNVKRGEGETRFERQRMTPKDKVRYFARQGNVLKGNTP